MTKEEAVKEFSLHFALQDLYPPDTIISKLAEAFVGEGSDFDWGPTGFSAAVLGFMVGKGVL